MLSWETKKTLLRLSGIADELLISARGASFLRSDQAFAQQLASLMDEIRTLLAGDDPVLEGEFRRIVLESAELPPDLRSAALAGWLKACLAVEAVEEKRRSDAQTREPRRRKQTLGFKIRSPIVREPEEESAGPASRR